MVKELYPVQGIGSWREHVWFLAQLPQLRCDTSSLPSRLVRVCENNKKPPHRNENHMKLSGVLTEEADIFGGWSFMF